MKEKTFVLNISNEEYGFVRVKAKSEIEAIEKFRDKDLLSEVQWNKQNIEVQGVQVEQ
jgi:hypothetical protein